MAPDTGRGLGGRRVATAGATAARRRRHGPAAPPETPAGATESEVVHAENKLALRRYEPRTERRLAVPVVVVPAIINRPTVLDFWPDRSVVRRFLDRGFDVYLLDWGEPSRLDARLGFDDLVARYLDACVDVVRERTGAPAVHLLGYCTGGTLAAIFAALWPGRVRTLGLLAPVLNFDAEGGIFRLWGDGDSYDPAALTGVYGNAPGAWLTVEFSLVDPVEYYLARYLRPLEHPGDADYAARFARRLRWGFDGVDVAGELYRQFRVDLYRENRLMEGRLTVGGEPVDIGNLEMPVLDVLGRDDRFIPAAASLPFLEVIPSADTTVIEFPTDHVGLAVDERSHAELWPRVCEWFAERSGEPPAGEGPRG